MEVATRAMLLHRANRRSIGSDAAQLISDEGLVAVAKMGHRTAFDELHQRHAAKMFRVAHRITRHREDAEDAVQESFLSAYVHLKNFEERARFSTWLTRITSNAALMKVRKNRLSREVSIEEPAEPLEFRPVDKLKDSSASPEEICAKGEQQAILRDAIAKLRPTLRKAVELYQLRERSLHETAKVLGISIAATKGRVFHALATLRRRRKKYSLARGAR
jgi:RNA polymerase sigma-70 factor (ECF subfamily)